MVRRLWGKDKLGPMAKLALKALAQSQGLWTLEIEHVELSCPTGRFRIHPPVAG